MYGQRGMQIALRPAARWVAGGDPYDLVFAVRVGALDGRHPAAGKQALERIAAATTGDARLFIDGGDPLRELSLLRS